MNIKGVSRLSVNRSTPEILSEFEVDLETLDTWNNNESARNIAYQAIDDIRDFATMDGYVIVDENSDLVAIASYEELSVNMLDNAYADIFKTHVSSGYQDCLFISRLAGTGRSGAYTIVKDLMQIAEFESKILVAEATERSVGFYERVGLLNTETTLAGRLTVFIYVPPRMKKRSR